MKTARIYKRRYFRGMGASMHHHTQSSTVCTPGTFGANFTKQQQVKNFINSPDRLVFLSFQALSSFLDLTTFSFSYSSRWNTTLKMWEKAQFSTNCIREEASTIHSAREISMIWGRCVHWLKMVLGHVVISWIFSSILTVQPMKSLSVHKITNPRG